MEKKYWNGIKVDDIKNVTKCGGSYSNDLWNEHFTLKMKDGNKHTLHYISKDKISYANQARRKIKQILNELNNVPETYLLENEIDARINGTSIKVGYRVENILDDYENFTLQEIEELRKQFKIRDDGWRHLCYIQVLEIEGNKVKRPVEQRWIDQLKYMGYDVDLLEYELKTTQ